MGIWSRVKGMAKRVGKVLFEPSSRLTDAVERRRARLLAKLQLVVTLQYVAGVFAVRSNETGIMREKYPPILLVAALGSLVGYFLSRTRHSRAAIWLNVFINFAVYPAALSFAQTEGTDNVIMSLGMMLPGVLLVSGMASGRATLLAGGLAAVVGHLTNTFIGHDQWGREFNKGMFFLLAQISLVIVFTVHRSNVEADRASELRRRNEELEALRHTLEEKVNVRTALLSARNADMRLVLDNVLEGVFTVDRAGTMSSEHAAVLQRWFGIPEKDQRLFDYLGRVAPAFGIALAHGWGQVFDDILPIDLALRQLPRAFVQSGRHYRVSYEITSDQGRILVVVSDVTSDVERENSQRERQESLAIFERIIEERAVFFEFIDESSELIATAGKSTTPVGDRARALHTLKGNSMIFGIASIGDLCHKAESALEERGECDAEMGPLVQRWEAVTKGVTSMLGTRRNVIELTPEQLEHMTRAATAARQEGLAKMLRDLALEPAERRLVHFAEQARRLAKRLDKKAVVEIHHDGVRLDGRAWSPLWAAMVHALRNAVDHGLELPDERRAAGKSEEGHLVLGAHRVDGAIVVDVEDDGRGIDWDKVRERCLSQGLTASSHDELVRGLFADGVSTAAEITEISGRGVGMGALLAAAQALGGGVDVRSERGLGTHLQVVIPAS